MFEFEFEFHNVRTSNVLAESKFDDCFKRLVVACEFVEISFCSTTDFIRYAQTARERR